MRRVFESRCQPQYWMAAALAAVLLLAGPTTLAPTIGESPVWAAPGDPGIQGLRSKSRSIDVRRRALRQMKRQKLNAARQMTSQIVTNQMKLDRARRDLYFQQDRFVKTRSLIGDLSSNIDQSMGRTARLSTDAGQRLRAIYTGSRVNMMEMILDSRNLSTLMDRLYYKNVWFSTIKSAEFLETTNRSPASAASAARQSAQLY